MKKLIVLIAALAGITMAAKAEQPYVNVSSRVVNDNSIEFYADIYGCGTFTVELIFGEVENLTVPKQKLFTITNSGVFLTIAFDDPSKSQHLLHFQYNWLQGAVDPEVNPDYVYRLPFNAGVSTTPNRLTNVDVRMFRGNFVDFAMWEFPLSKDDTIFASRAGQVVMIEGFYTKREGDTQEAFYADMNNAIYIEHADGTTGVYSVLDNSSLMVSLGDMVYPDTPLAKAGASEKGGHAVRFSLSYYVTNRSELYANMFAQKRYLNPVFSTEFGAIRLDDQRKNGNKDAETVTAQADKKLIAAEKPKRNFWQRLFGGKK